MIIIGAKGHAKEVLDIVEHQVQKIFFYDNINIFLNKKLFDIFPILSSEDEVLSCFLEDRSFAIGVGNVKLRFELTKLFKSWGGELTSVISKSAIIGSHSIFIGAGANIMHQVIISNCVKIGEGVLINSFASIHHDVVIGDYCEISPGVRVLGEVSIGDFCSLGSGAIILPKVKIGNNVTIGAGSVVTKNIPSHSLAIGVPARIIKQF